MDHRIPCVMMRGGTSRGPVFLKSDLPGDDAAVDRILIAAMGSPHPLQVNGIGGGNSLTSKVAIVSRSAMAGVDVDYLFVQVNVESATTDRKPNCGNMLSAVGPFAIEAGLVPAASGETLVTVRNTNTGSVAELIVQTPMGKVCYEGAARIDGVAGTAAPIRVGFVDTIGAVTGSLLPTGLPLERIDGVEVSLIDAAMPMMLVRGSDLGLTGRETAIEIDASFDMLSRVEALRLEAGRRMGLGDVSGLVVPKVGIVFPPAEAGTLRVRYLTPRKCHTALAVTGAVTLASAAYTPGTLAQDLSALSDGHRLRFEHPAGIFDLETEIRSTPNPAGTRLVKASLVRTARRIFEGTIIVPQT